MNKNILGRRKFVKNSVAAASLITLPSLLTAQSNKNKDKKKVVVVGGHPDDPECGCGGTIAKLIENGHDVTLLYLTNGDEGVEGKSNEEAAAIRKAESIASCKVLGAKPLFANQVDGETVMNNDEMARFEKLLWAENPDVVFTHWPLDSHKDHQIASILTMQAWMEAKTIFSLYFYEVCIGYQSFVFHPTEYVDISEYVEKKKKCLACHKSQDIVVNGEYTANMLDCGHPAMQDFRGREYGAKAAEAYIRMTGRQLGKLNL